MSKSKKQYTGIRWDVIFENNPELTPPGYQETVNALYKEKNNAKPEK